MTDKKRVFEQDTVGKAILKLALPSVLGQVILVIYNMADTLFIGMTGRDEAITAVTVCMPALMFLSAISNLFGIGGGSVISRALGTGDCDGVRRTAAFSFWGCLLVSVGYCAASALWCDGFLNLLGGTDPAVHADARIYLCCAVAAGGVFTALSALFSHLVRAFGYAVHASAGIFLGGVLNIVLDPLLMFRLLPAGNEVFGAALATAISNAVSFLYYLVVLRINRKTIRLSFRFSKEIFAPAVSREVVYVGMAAFLMTLCENISYAVLDKLLSVGGIAMQAGIGVAKKVNMLAHCFVRGMAQGVLPLIAYNYASGNRKRMKQVVSLSGAISVGISLVCLAVCFLFGKPMIEIFIPNGGDSVAYGTRFLKILCLGAPFSAFAYTVISFFQATGQGGKSLLLALLRKGILDIPLMLVFAYAVSTTAVVAATPIADAVCCLTAVIFFGIFLRERERRSV